MRESVEPSVVAIVITDTVYLTSSVHLCPAWVHLFINYLSPSYGLLAELVVTKYASWICHIL